mgnify:FL=1
MIRLLRVDDSFLYGKKALLWINATRAKVIVLIDNGLRFDYFAQSLLTMACPPQAELVFLDVEEARAAAGQYRNSREPVLMVAGSFSQLLGLSPSLEGLVRVNVGESSSDELQALKKLREQDMEFEICDLPEDVPVRLE